jgi:superfamily II DNA helicase RecQ
MCIQNDKFRGLLCKPEFSKHIHVFIIDEAHCILQWGDKFREEYSKLGTQHAFVLAQVPFLVTSATLTPDDLSKIRKLLHIELSQTYALNLGNDRPNITWNVRHMQAGKSDIESLRFLLPHNLGPETPRLESTIVYFDDINLSMEAWRWFRSQLPPHLCNRVTVYNAWRGLLSKDFVLHQFWDSNIDILFASEAAGMVSTIVYICSVCAKWRLIQGCDMPNVKIVVQFMMPKSLSIWLQ